MKKYLTLILLIASTTAFAQKTNFSGVWTLSERQSLSGMDYGNGVPSKITIQQETNNIKIETITAGQNGDVTATETVPLNGTEATSETPSHRSRKSSLAWTSDKNELIETSAFSTPENKDTPANKVKLTYSLSADGKTLTLIKEFVSVTDANDKWSMKGTYTKQ